MKRLVNDFFVQYKDPRWQRKKYKIMEQRSWQCEWCRTTDHQLRVHHAYYERGKMVWEYPDDSLYCLCDRCHKKANELKRHAQRILARIHPKYLNECARRISAFKEAIGNGHVDQVIQFPRKN